MFLSFLIAGILHPYEIGCLPYLVIYYITIPSMYLLLTIYSLFNLWNVSWGTREVAQKKTKVISPMTHYYICVWLYDVVRTLKL